MDTLEQQLHDRMHRAGGGIAVPATDPADDVRRGRAGLRRQRAVTVGGAALAVAAVAGGAVSLAGGGEDNARSIDPATAGPPSPSASATPDPRPPEITVSGDSGTDRGFEPSESFSFPSEQVDEAIAGYEAAVLAGLDPEGAGGGPDLTAAARDHLMQGDAEPSGDGATGFTIDPSFLGADFVLRTPDGRSSLSLDVEDIPPHQEHAEGQPPEGGWDDGGAGGRVVCHEVDLGRDDVVKARYLERDGQLVGAIVDKSNGETVSLIQVNDIGNPEPPLPWTSDELFAVLLDPALTLPHVR
ncbi:hypothetical protein D0Z08_10955 [Nocardioides immobilis]|uniref:Uncharacterized protein n=1 Tax=Nocardioides immobilis TaxID=2049295 RepID=A0A417Y3R8_9ACTN|nr:hypothetical protein [Nocardioides immobilis]RHW27174.1 hypothetical protein D0Z08_10955 [Nocardioides immobilis]